MSDKYIGKYFLEKKSEDVSYQGFIVKKSDTHDFYECNLFSWFGGSLSEEASYSKHDIEDRFTVFSTYEEFEEAAQKVWDETGDKIEKHKNKLDEAIHFVLANNLSKLQVTGECEGSHWAHERVLKKLDGISIDSLLEKLNGHIRYGNADDVYYVQEISNFKGAN